MDIKLIAFISMLLDHFASVFLRPGAVYYCLRAVGRLAFPLFLYCAVRGFYCTSSLKRYIGRLFLLGLLSQAPYVTAFGLHRLNVLFELCGVLLVLAGLQMYSLRRFAGLMLGLLLCRCSEYGFRGLALGVALYALWNRPEYKWLVSFLLARFLNTGFYRVSALSIPLIAWAEYKGYNRKSPRWCYLIYPLHLALFVLLRYLIRMVI